MNTEQVKCPVCGALGYEGSTCEYCGTLINVSHIYGAYTGDSIIRQRDHGYSPCPVCGALGKIGSKCTYCGNLITESVKPDICKARLVPQRTISSEQFAEKVANYKYVGQFDEQSKCAKVVIGSNAGIINADGDVIVPCDYLDCYISGYFALLFQERKQYLLDLKGGNLYETHATTSKTKKDTIENRNYDYELGRYISHYYSSYTELPLSDVTIETKPSGNVIVIHLTYQLNDSWDAPRKWETRAILVDQGIEGEGGHFAGVYNICTKDKRYLTLEDGTYLGCIDYKWKDLSLNDNGEKDQWGIYCDDENVFEVDFINDPQNYISAINNYSGSTPEDIASQEVEEERKMSIWSILGIVIMAIFLILKVLGVGT